MSKAIRSYPKDQQAKVVARRLNSQTKGLGYWAAKGWKPAKPENKESAVVIIAETLVEAAKQVEAERAA